MYQEGLREMLADNQHDIWAHWMRWLFSICVVNEDGSVVIPPELVARWQRQVDTAYYNLTEREKDSDRRQADKVIEVIEAVAAIDAVNKANGISDIAIDSDTATNAANVNDYFKMLIDSEAEVIADIPSLTSDELAYSLEAVDQLDQWLMTCRLTAQNLRTAFVAALSEAQFSKGE